MIENNDVKAIFTASPRPVRFLLLQRKIFIAKEQQRIRFGAVINEDLLLGIEMIGEIPADVEIIEDRTLEIFPMKEYRCHVVAGFESDAEIPSAAAHEVNRTDEE